MRGLVRIIISGFFCFISTYSFAQVDYDKIDSTTEEMMEKGDWNGLANYGTDNASKGVDYFTMNDRTGRALFSLKLFSKAEIFLKKALKQNSSSSETAQYLYGSLLEQGRDLEAGAIRKKYSVYGGGDTKKIIEGFYGEGGVKISSLMNKVGNVQYMSFGMTHRPSYCSRIWQAFTYLNQNFHADGFKQYEYFVSINNYVGHYFYIRPSFHYAYTHYTSNSSLTQPYFSSTSQVVQNGIVTNEINATQLNNYGVWGNINSLNIAANISRRFGSFTLEAEPSVHFINTQQRLITNKFFTGTTDTFINGTNVGSGNYSTAINNIISDSVTVRHLIQISTGITYRLPLEYVTLKLMGHFVTNRFEQQEFDASFSAFIRAHNKLWIHLSYLEKKDMPLVLNDDGQYFNAGNPVKSRVSFSFQLHPMKKFTQYITYQHEEQGKLNSSTTNQYNSFYLTLKYNL